MGEDANKTPGGGNGTQRELGEIQATLKATVTQLSGVVEDVKAIAQGRGPICEQMRCDVAKLRIAIERNSEHVSANAAQIAMLAKVDLKHQSDGTWYATLAKSPVALGLLGLGLGLGLGIALSSGFVVGKAFNWI